MYNEKQSYLVNAFSLNMFPWLDKYTDGFDMRISPIEVNEIPIYAMSYIGHGDMANILTNILGRKVEFNRSTLIVPEYSTVYIAQYIGERLQEGTTKLPEGSTIKFFVVEC